VNEYRQEANAITYTNDQVNLYYVKFLMKTIAPSYLPHFQGKMGEEFNRDAHFLPAAFILEAKNGECGKKKTTAPSRLPHF
jgi:hypothetical protein